MIMIIARGGQVLWVHQELAELSSDYFRCARDFQICERKRAENREANIHAIGDLNVGSEQHSSGPLEKGEASEIGDEREEHSSPSSEEGNSMEAQSQAHRSEELAQIRQRVRRGGLNFTIGDRAYTLDDDGSDPDDHERSTSEQEEQHEQAMLASRDEFCVQPTTIDLTSHQPRTVHMLVAWMYSRTFSPATESHDIHHMIRLYLLAHELRIIELQDAVLEYLGYMLKRWKLPYPNIDYVNHFWPSFNGKPEIKEFFIDHLARVLHWASDDQRPAGAPTLPRYDRELVRQVVRHKFSLPGHSNVMRVPSCKYHAHNRLSPWCPYEDVPSNSSTQPETPKEAASS